MQYQNRVRRNVDARASWVAALRTGAAGSQDESRCSAIHKQRPYRGCAWKCCWGAGGHGMRAPTTASQDVSGSMLEFHRKIYD